MSVSSRRSRPPTGRTNVSQARLHSSRQRQRTPASIQSNCDAQTSPIDNHSIYSQKSSCRLSRPSTSLSHVSGITHISSASKDSKTLYENKLYGHFMKDQSSTSSGFKSRSQLLDARKYERLHFFDKYDLDGDGTVDPFEVFLGSLVDTDKDGNISEKEKQILRDMIEDGKLKHLSILQDKNGGGAKKCLTWFNSKEGRREQLEKQQRQQEREQHQQVKNQDDSNSVASSVNPNRESEQVLSKLADDMLNSGQASVPITLRPDPSHRLEGRHTPTLEYKENPRFRTRTELLAARKQQDLSPSSYDLDGDGHVDALEYFIARQIDTNKDGDLSEEERKQALHLRDSLNSKYIVGLDGAGVHNANQGFRIKQTVDGQVKQDMYLEAQDDYDIKQRMEGAIAKLQQPDSALDSREEATAPSRPPRPPTSNTVLSRAGSAVSTHSKSPPRLQTARSSSSIFSSASRARSERSTSGRSISLSDTIRESMSQSGRSNTSEVSAFRPSTGMSRLIGM